MAEPIERLLLASEIIVRAVVAWDAIPKHADQAQGLLCWGPGVFYDHNLWMIVAGLARDDHAQISTTCRTLGFIREDGSVWSEILTVARATAAKQIKKAT